MKNIPAALAITLITSLCGAIAYGFTTFATIDYSDKKDNGIIEIINVVRDDVREIRNYMIPKGHRRKE